MQLYDVSLETPLGQRRGQAALEIRGTHVQGELTLMNHTEALSGEIAPDGSCHLVGNLTTLLRRIPYTAEGTITRNRVALTVKEKRNVFSLVGTAISEERNEKDLCRDSTEVL